MSVYHSFTLFTLIFLDRASHYWHESYTRVIERIIVWPFSTCLTLIQLSLKEKQAKVRRSKWVARGIPIVTIDMSHMCLLSLRCHTAVYRQHSILPPPTAWVTWCSCNFLTLHHILNKVALIYDSVTYSSLFLYNIEHLPKLSTSLSPPPYILCVNLILCGLL